MVKVLGTLKKKIHFKVFILQINRVQSKKENQDKIHMRNRFKVLHENQVFRIFIFEFFGLHSGFVPKSFPSQKWSWLLPLRKLVLKKVILPEIILNDRKRAQLILN